MVKLLNKLPTHDVFRWMLFGLPLLSSLLLLPFGSNPIETSKLLLLLLVVFLSLIALTLQFLKSSPPVFKSHPIAMALVFLAVSTAVSTLFSLSHPLSQLSGFGGSWLGFFGLVFVGTLLLEKKSPLSLAGSFGLVGSSASVLFLLELIGLKISALYTFLFGQVIAQSIGFSPVGSAFILAQLALIAAAACAAAFKKSHATQKNWFLAGIIVNVVALVVAGWLCLPAKPASPVILPWSANWSVALDSLRNPKTAVLGVGPDNFTIAYTKFKPSWMNTTVWWNVEFMQGSTLPFTILITQGLLGLLAWGYLCFVSIKESKKLFKASPVTTIIFFTLLVLTLLIPPTTFLLTLLTVTVVSLIADTKELYETVGPQPSLWQKITHSLPFLNLPPSASQYGLAACMALITLVFGVFTVQLIRSEFRQFQANQQTLKGNIVQLYELQKKAISVNPYNDVSRRQYALTNLAIASAVSNKADISEEDMQKVAILVQQAIRESRAAVLISPEKAQNWETLGDIYTNFIGIMDGSDALALEAYRQAIQYSPNNPNLFIKLGGVFYRQTKYQEALLSFEQAALIKPDLANSYYNAANTFRQMNDVPAAENAYKQTLLILEKTSGSASEEYLKASVELEELQTQKAASESAETQSSNDQ